MEGEGYTALRIKKDTKQFFLRSIATEMILDGGRITHDDFLMDLLEEREEQRKFTPAVMVSAGGNPWKEKEDEESVES